jgi:hypothetical protein
VGLGETIEHGGFPIEGGAAGSVNKQQRRAVASFDDVNAMAADANQSPWNIRRKLVAPIRLLLGHQLPPPGVERREQKKEKQKARAQPDQDST